MSNAHERSEATFLELRRQLFQKTEELSAGAGPKVDVEGVLGVILETPANSGCSIVYALADGSAGVFPGRAHIIDHPRSELTRARARDVCQVANAVQTQLAGISESSQPPPALVVADYVRVFDQQAYHGSSARGLSSVQGALALDPSQEPSECVQLSVMRNSGIVHARGDEVTLGETEGPLGDLYRAMLELEAAIDGPSPEITPQGRTYQSTASEPQPLGKTPPVNSVNTVSSSGDLSQDFVNRLLTCLAAGSFDRVEHQAVVLSSDAPLPQLEGMVSEGPHRDWLRTHPLATEAIRSDDVIDRVLADARRRFFSRRLELHRVLTTEAGPIEADFDLRLTQTRTGTRTLEISASQRS